MHLTIKAFSCILTGINHYLVYASRMFLEVGGNIVYLVMHDYPATLLRPVKCHLLTTNFVGSNNQWLVFLSNLLLLGSNAVQVPLRRVSRFD